MSNMTIPKNSRVFVAGMTGSGKSFLAEHYLRTYKYVVKLDTKGEYYERKKAGLSAWDGLTENEDFTVVFDLDRLDEVDTDKIIFVPSYDIQTVETFNIFFHWIFTRENTILWIDELMSVGTPNKYPSELGRLYQQGRSKNVGIWACTQRPSGIPVITMANSEYFFVFNLVLKDDRTKLYMVTGMEQMKVLPKGRNFWFHRLGDLTAVKAVLKL